LNGYEIKIQIQLRLIAVIFFSGVKIKSFFDMLQKKPQEFSCGFIKHAKRKVISL